MKSIIRLVAVCAGSGSVAIAATFAGCGDGSSNEWGLNAALLDARAAVHVDGSSSDSQASGADSPVLPFDAGPPTSNDPTGLIPPDRRTTWNPGLHSVGGIPQRSTTCATIQPSGGDDTQPVQTAVNACPANQVVLLAAGDFHFSSSVNIAYDPNTGMNQSNITVRGAGPGTPGSGTGGTRVLVGGGNAAFTIGTNGTGAMYYTQPVNLTADAPRGTATITLASNPGYAVGELVTISESLDPTISWFAPGHGNGGVFNLPNSPIGQVLEIQSVNGNQVTFSTPLHMDYKTAQSALVSRHWKGFGAANTTPLEYSGVEDMYIEGQTGGGGSIAVLACKYCWVKNVEINKFSGAAIDLQRTFRAEVRDSYVHTTRDPNPGGGGYALSFSWYAADNLAENNVTWAVNKVEVARSTGGGNVWGYNYFEDGFGAGYPTIPEVGMNASHYPTPHMELFEGNEAWDAESDIVWGNSVYLTFFRNHMTGRRRGLATQYVDSNGTEQTITPPISDVGIRHAAGMGAYDDWFNFVGNVLGTAGDVLAPQTTAVYEKDAGNMCDQSVFAIWMLGWGDTQGNCGIVEPAHTATLATVLRHGNYDYVTQSTVWDPTISRHDMPPSLYLTAKPAFFGSNAWPWVTPENPANPVATLPARARFDAMH